MYRRYQNRATRSELICFMGAEPTRERSAGARALRRVLDDEGANEFDELIFRQLVFEQLDHLLGPIDGIIKSRVAAIGTEKQPHRAKGRALVALFKGMCSRHAIHERHRKNDKIILAIRESIARTRQSAFEQADISNEMVFAGVREFELVVFDDCLYRNPDKFIRQGAL